MVATRIGDDTIIFRFGGGLNTRASEDDIREIEAAAGENFKIDARNRELRNRNGFELLGTTPNAAEIRGFVNLKDQAGSVSMLVQAAGVVYEWNGSTFSQVGTCNATSKLRGPLSSNFLLNDYAIVTDLNLAQPVMTWDGTTFATMTENLAGDFLAKYCIVFDERAYFANVISNAVATPHMIVGSTREDNTTLSVTDRPSSSLGAADPFYLLSPDLRPINGLSEIFTNLVFSSENGRMFKLVGSDATDYQIDQLYAGSFASGDESLVFAGNDIAYGKQGKIESLLATEKFGDVEADDLSIDISDQIETFSGWTSVYNSRFDRLYFFPGGANAQVWVFHKSVPDVSPWSKWTTQHASSFQPSAVMSMLDPSDGLEYTYFGDSSGNLYRMETSNDDDAGANIKVSWTTKLFSVPHGGQIDRVEGWVKYRKNEAATVTLTLLYDGEQVFNEPITVNITADTGGDYFGGDVWWGGDYYWGSTFFDRIVRERIAFPGGSNDFRLKVEVDGSSNVRINEVGLRFQTQT